AARDVQQGESGKAHLTNRCFHCGYVRGILHAHRQGRIAWLREAAAKDFAQVAALSDVQRQREVQRDENAPAARAAEAHCRLRFDDADDAQALLARKHGHAREKLGRSAEKRRVCLLWERLALCGGRRIRWGLLALQVADDELLADERFGLVREFFG